MYILKFLLCTLCHMTYMHDIFSTWLSLNAIPICCEFPSCMLGAVPLSFIVYVLNQNVVPYWYGIT